MLIGLLGLHDQCAGKQEVDDVIPQVKRQVIAWTNRRWPIAVTFLEHTPHKRHTAKHSWQFLPQCVNEAVAPGAAGITQVIALTFDVDVNNFASIPIRLSWSSKLLDIVCVDANASLADVWRIVAPCCVGMLRGPRQFASRSTKECTKRIPVIRVSRSSTIGAEKCASILGRRRGRSTLERRWQLRCASAKHAQLFAKVYRSGGADMFVNASCNM